MPAPTAAPRHRGGFRPGGPRAEEGSGENCLTLRLENNRADVQSSQSTLSDVPLVVIRSFNECWVYLKVHDSGHQMVGKEALFSFGTNM